MAIFDVKSFLNNIHLKETAQLCVKKQIYIGIHQKFLFVGYSKCFNLFYIFDQKY